MVKLKFQKTSLILIPGHLNIQEGGVTQPIYNECPFLKRNNSNHLLSVYCVPGTTLNPSHALIHQIFSMYSQGGYPYLRYEETEVSET